MKAGCLFVVVILSVLLCTNSLFAVDVTQDQMNNSATATNAGSANGVNDSQTLPPPPTTIMPPPANTVSSNAAAANAASSNAFSSVNLPPEATPHSVPVASAPTTSQDATLEEFRQWISEQEAAKNKSAAAVPPRAFNPYPTSTPMGQRRMRTAKPFTYEQGLLTMQQSVPPNSPNASPDGDIAFQAMVRKNMPMTPLQIVQLHQQIDMSQRAAAIPANIPPKPVSTTIMINLAPGATPPAIRLAQGYVSSLVFVDSTGTPWPIAAFDIGNPKAMSIQWDGKSNIMLIQAISPYSDGDMVVRLVGLPTPITLELVAGQRVVDYRVDLHVSGIGPNTKELPIGTNLPASANQLLLGVLDGVAPAGSKQLEVEGADCQAWLLGDNIYFRTRLTVLSPGWIGKMVSPDGMFAYELPKTSSVLVSRYGEPVELKVEGF